MRTKINKILNIMKKSDNVIMNENYESPIVKLVEFEVEVGFAASMKDVSDNTGVSGVIWTTTPGNTY